MSNLEIAYRKVADLVPYARNPRKNDHAVDQVAAVIREFGFRVPIIAKSDGTIVDGHLRYKAAQKLGLAEVPTVSADDLTETQIRALRISVNRMADLAEWDAQLLELEVAELEEVAFPTELVGFDLDAVAALAEEQAKTPEVQVLPPGPMPGEDDVPEVKAEAVTRLGDVWLLGKHRVMCGDSTSIDAVEKLMAGQKAQLLHADPPYGMGKEKDGVANDNLYGADLDRFQLEWWATWRTFLTDNASVYIWGNAPDLWRLWYRAGLGDSERLEFRNEIVWDKRAVPGMASATLTQYPEASERCLFFQIGQQFLGNINIADFPESWENLRAYMEVEARSAGVKAADILRVCGCHMWGHWFTRSQFRLIPEKHYRALATAYPGYFSRPWADLSAEWSRVRGGPTSEIQGARSYFDNAHEAMRDVWEFSRVSGEERHGHATPKPVAMMERVMRTSLPPDGVCVEPFGGSGSTLIGAEKTGRVCFTMELTPAYCDVIVRRWQKATGQAATLEGDGRTFDAVAEAGR